MTNIQFKNATKEEYQEFLDSFNVSSFESLIGEDVHYVKPSYGLHTVKDWNPLTEEYLLTTDGGNFWSSPFYVKKI